VFDSRRGLRIILFATASRTALGPTQPPIHWVQGALSLGVKQPGREAGHSPPSSTEIEGCAELYLHSPNKPPWRCAQLKHRDNFSFTFFIKEGRQTKCLTLIIPLINRFLCVTKHQNSRNVSNYKCLNVL
jgi:hypothetical protein